MGACSSAPDRARPLPSFVRRLPAGVLGAGPTPNVRDVYTLGRVLGRGAFGTTRAASAKDGTGPAAVKSVPLARLRDAADVDALRREVDILARLDHAHVVRLQGVFEDAANRPNPHVHLAMDLCAGGELFDAITRRGYFSEACAAKLLRVIVSTLDYCHAAGVVHRDVKPENLLLESTDPASSLKLADFGLAACVHGASGKDPLRDVVGSPYYIAPEVLTGRGYGRAADLWSAGAVLYMLLSGRPPFLGATEEDVLDAVSRDDLDTEGGTWGTISPAAKAVVRGLLTRDPRKRWTARQVLDTAWVKQDACGKDMACREIVFSGISDFQKTQHARRAAAAALAADLKCDPAAVDALRETLRGVDTDGTGEADVKAVRDAIARAGSAATARLVARLLARDGLVPYDALLGATMRKVVAVG